MYLKHVCASALAVLLNIYSGERECRWTSESYSGTIIRIDNLDEFYAMVTVLFTHGGQRPHRVKWEEIKQRAVRVGTHIQCTVDRSLSCISMRLYMRCDITGPTS